MLCLRRLVGRGPEGSVDRALGRACQERPGHAVHAGARGASGFGLNCSRQGRSGRLRAASPGRSRFRLSQACLRPLLPRGLLLAITNIRSAQATKRCTFVPAGAARGATAGRAHAPRATRAHGGRDRREARASWARSTGRPPAGRRPSARTPGGGCRSTDRRRFDRAIRAPARSRW